MDLGFRVQGTSSAVVPECYPFFVVHFVMSVCLKTFCRSLSARTPITLCNLSIFPARVDVGIPVLGSPVNLPMMPGLFKSVVRCPLKERCPRTGSRRWLPKPLSH